MSEPVPPALTIVIPVYNDWESLNLLLGQIEHCLANVSLKSVEILIINDASVSDHNILQQQIDTFTVIKNIHILHLSCNLGSQRSIAIGLAYTANKLNSDTIIVMDSDGEDRPEDLPRLLEQSLHSSNNVIVAERSKRSETFLFRFMYYIYKLMFRLLTGQRISFGNFCLVPANQMKKLIYRSELWINLPATIIRSRIPFEKIPTKRGKRLMGKSSMNFPNLVVHGMSAIAVYSDTTLVRMLFIFLLLSVFFVASLLILFATPLSSIMHLPDQIFYIGLFLFFVCLQSAIIAVLVIFHLFSNWSQNPLIPNIHYENYIWQVEKYYSNR